jgi:hypothetical protein
MDVPEGLRPGQLGVVMLGRVIMGDVAVTLVDLAQRGLVDVKRIEDPDTGNADWTLQPGSWPDTEPEYTRALLGGLADYREPARLAPGRRLIALAGYLGLNWPWLWQRCAELSDQGCAGLAQPRSRLLSTNGVDAALRYVGMLGRDTARP